MDHHLGKSFESSILECTGATSLELGEVIQELWSGYGVIQRIVLSGTDRASVVVKHVTMPGETHHPRGWNSDLSHQRKVFSYQVESEWYRNWGTRCDHRCRIPGVLSFARDGERILLVLEDLDSAGFPVRLSAASQEHIDLCLGWLAEFHATFMGENPVGLWEVGTYWHLGTRPDELEALDDAPLKAAALAIDQILSSARFQSFVHGDAKLANFCFSEDHDRVAALDFQYVGGGCGMKDVAYFIGSCLDEAACESREGQLLNYYFEKLGNALDRRQSDLDAEAVISEWRGLFPFAWTDFHRFLKGWCPGHWKINSYSERIATQVLSSL